MRTSTIAQVVVAGSVATLLISSAVLWRLPDERRSDVAVAPSIPPAAEVPTSKPNVDANVAVPHASGPVTAVRPDSPKTIPPPNLVRQFLERNTTAASVALAAPAAVTRDEAATVILQLAPSTISPDALEEALRDQLGTPSVGDSASVRMAARMLGSLSCDRPCQITLLTPPAERAVDFAQGATWRWSVIPTRETGTELELTASLVAPLVIDGRDSHYTVGVYTKRLRVQIGYGQRFTDVLGAASTQLAMLTTVAGAVVAVLAWWGNRRSRRRPAGFRT